MQTRRCAVLVDGKICALAITLVDRDVDSGTAIYECPLGHRSTYVPLDKGQATRCRVFVDGKECGLAVTQVNREIETGTATYECALGHRTHVPLPPEPPDN